MKISLKKFPVVSSNGNNYEVSMFVGETVYDYGFNIVLKKKAKGLFHREKWDKVASYNYDSLEDALYKFGGFIEIAKIHVKRYEREQKEAEEYKERVKLLSGKFEDWSGYINE